MYCHASILILESTSATDLDVAINMVGYGWRATNKLVMPLIRLLPGSDNCTWTKYDISTTERRVQKCHLTLLQNLSSGLCLARPSRAIREIRRRLSHCQSGLNLHEHHQCRDHSSDYTTTERFRQACISLHHYRYLREECAYNRR